MQQFDDDDEMEGGLPPEIHPKRWTKKKIMKVLIIAALPTLIIIIILLCIAYVGKYDAGSPGWGAGGLDDLFLQAEMPCGDKIAGVLSGENVIKWSGVRYARPPLGQRRWEHARRLESDCYWTSGSTLVASQSGAVCMQLVPIPDGVNMSEDCLYLDVMAPRTGLGPYPVVFWIHGGSNVAASNEWYTNLTVLADELKAVVVAPNYRLNALGFLALSALSSQSDTGTSGNYGISDLIMALQWTHANIASFRGDPNAVTLLGQSSGATNIFALIANASNAPSLFRAAIALSGSANLSMSLATAEKQNAKYALAQSKCASGIDDFEIVSCLRGMSAEDANSLFTDDAYDTNVIAPCAAEGCSSPRNPFLYLGLPVVDGFVIKTSAMDAMQNLPKGFHTLLLQSTQGESEFKPDPTIDDAWSMEDFKQWMNNTFVGKLGYDENLFSQILDIHLKDVTLRTNLERYSALVSDPGATFPLLALARNVNGARVLVGYVRCPPSSPFPVSSNQSATIAFHMWDYVAATGSYNLFLQPPISAYGPFSPNLQDREFGRQIRSQWRSIVHGESTLPWSEFGVNENVGVIDCSLTSSVHMFRQDLEQLWRRIVKGPWEDYWWIN